MDATAPVPAARLAPLLVHELLPLLAVQGALLDAVLAGARGRTEGAETGQLQLARELTADVRRTVELLATAGRRVTSTSLADVAAGVLRRHPGSRVSVWGGAGASRVDGARLGAVLDNLVRNEREHGANPSPRVVMASRGSRVGVDVHHVGEAPRHLLTALEADDPVDAGDTPAVRGGPRRDLPTPSEGRGLGLVLVRHLLEQMDGSLRVRELGLRRWAVHVDVSALPAAS